MHEKILSICIPTYNRSEVLDKSLSQFVKEPSFLDKSIEICISDNASTDNTEEIVKKYTNKFDNIIYHKNKKNTGVIDGNFPIVGSLATGTFIKFLNDYAYFYPGELDRMITFIKKNEREKPVLLFTNNNYIESKNEILECKGINEFVKHASYWITWVLCAGFWRIDFENIRDRDRSISKFMWCPDNYLKLVSSGRKAIIYNRKFAFEQPLKSKGGYNLFKTFSIDYLSMYDEYLNNHQLDKKVYEKEKYKLMRYFFSSWLYTLKFVNTNNYNFGVKNAFDILKKTYGKHLYFYIIIFLVNFKGTLRQLIKR